VELCPGISWITNLDSDPPASSGAEQPGRGRRSQVDSQSTQKEGSIGSPSQDAAVPDPRNVLLFSLLIQIELSEQQLEWLIQILPALWQIGSSTNYHYWCQKKQDWSHSPAYEHDFYKGKASIWIILMKVKQA
jgi:hypothetical protein